MRFFIKKIFLVFISVLFFVLIFTSVQALTDGMSATDLLGQYDQTNFTNPIPEYTKSVANDGPNKFGFNGAGGMLFDLVQHRFFIVDGSNNRILIYNLNNDNTFPDRVPDNVLGQDNFYSRTAYDTQAGLNAPSGLAYDATNNRLFVSENTGNRVKVFDVTAITDGEPAVNVLGQVDFTSNGSANTQSGMRSPNGLAYDSTNNRLFVSEYDGHRVKVWDVTDITDGENAINVLGQVDFTSSNSGNTQSLMRNPSALAYDSTNNRLFVAEATVRRVKVFDVTAITDGENAVNILGQPNFTSSTFAHTQSGMASANGLAYDSINNRLFVSEGAGYRVKVWDVTAITDGENAINVLGQVDFTSNVSANTQSGMISAGSLTYDSVNSRFFVSEGNHVKVFDVTAIIDGEPAVDLLGQYDQTSFTDPVPVYTKSGANDSPNKFGFSGLQDVAIDAVNHRFFVADYANNRILVYNLDSNNNFIDRIPDNVLGQPNFYTNATAHTQSGMFGPNSIEYDSINNRLFVSEWGGHRVKVFDVTAITDGENAINVLGQVDFTSNVSASTQAGMTFATGLVLDATNNRLFVSESGNNRVKIYDVTAITDGEPAVNVLGQVDFTSSAANITQVGMSGPQDLIYDSVNNRLFVAEYGGNRVKVYDVTAITDGEPAVNVLGQPNFVTGVSTNSQSGLNTPNGITYDVSHDLLFVSELSGHRVKVFDVTAITDGENAINVLGQVDFTSSAANITQVGMSGPIGIEYDGTNDRLFVSQGGANRISIFDISDVTISSISASPDLDSFTAEWITNEIASSKLEYGLTDTYGSITSETDTSPRVLSHSVTITGLTSCTTYHYRVISANAGGNVATSSNAQFTTGGCNPGGGGGSSGGGGGGIIPSIINPVITIIDNIINPTPENPVIPEVETPIEVIEVIEVTEENTIPDNEVITEDPINTEEVNPTEIEITNEYPTYNTENIPNQNPTNTNNNSTPLSSLGSLDVPVQNVSTFSVVKEQIKETLKNTTVAIKLAKNETKKVLESKEGNIAEKAITAGGVVVGASFTIASTLFASPLSFSEVVLIPLRLWSVLIGALGLKRKNRRWGVVYDSVTKQPLDPVYVTLNNLEGKEIASTITDINGRYGFLVYPGVYMLIAKKSDYLFPSSKLAGKSSDELYSNIYWGDYFRVTNEGEVIAKNIPLDPVSFNWNEFEKNKKNMMIYYNRRDVLLARISNVFFIFGFIVALIALLVVSKPYNIAIFSLYVFIFMFKRIGLKTKKKGSVTEKSTNLPLSFGIVRILLVDLDQEVARKVIDKTGHFYCLVQNGTYRVRIEKKNSDGSYSEVYKNDKVIIKNGVLNTDFLV